MKKIRVGSRESALAVAQARIVMDYLKNCGFETELVTMKTTGDMILDKPLDKIGGKGLFVKELDRALIDGAVDITVHSYKDMPMGENADLPVVAVSKRENPRDVLVLPIGVNEPDLSKPIGCSSARRTIALKRLYPRHGVAPLRGNVLTRLDKLDRGEYSAIVLAYAGLARLRLSDRVSRVFETHEMLPAACQGILAVQARRDFDRGILAGFNCPEAFDAAQAERAFVTELDGGCSSPVAAYAEIIDENSMHITGFYIDGNGNERTGTLRGLRRDSVVMGLTLVQKLREGTV